MRFYVYDGTSAYYVEATGAVKDVDVWFYVVGVFNRGKTDLYLNGKLVASDTFPFTSVPDTTHSVGIATTPDAKAYYFNGDVAFAWIYTRALTKREIIYNMLNYHNPVRDGLVLWLHDRIIGNTWYDESGMGNHGAIHGAVRRNLAMWEMRAEVGL